jgi:hypothetical protein
MVRRSFSRWSGDSADKPPLLKKNIYVKVMERQNKEY